MVQPSDKRLITEQTLLAPTGPMETRLGDFVESEDGQVPMSAIPSAAGPSPSTLVLRRPSGAVAASPAGASDETPTKAQVDAALQAASFPGNGAEVRSQMLAAEVLAADASTWQGIPSLGISDAATNQIWLLSLMCTYEASVQGGLDLRIAPAVVSGNALSNPSFETGVAPWTGFPGNINLARSTTQAAYDGTGYLVITTGSTTNTQVWSETVPAAPGEVWSVGAYFRWGGGATPKTCRCDLQYLDAADTVIDTYLGDVITPGSSPWTRSTDEGHAAPEFAAKVRVRLATTGPETGDIIHADGVQLVKDAVLPPYSGGSGSASGITVNSVGMLGDYRGLKLAPAGNEDYSRLVPVRYGSAINSDGATNGVNLATFGGLGAGVACRVEANLRFVVSGVGVSGLTLKPEIKQRVLDGAVPTRMRAQQSLAIWSRIA